MDLLVLPDIENVHSRERTRDELPRSAAGKTIMTTEPKFIWKTKPTFLEMPNRVKSLYSAPSSKAWPVCSLVIMGNQAVE